LFQGFNATLFAYGSTGAGKSYSMFGEFSANNTTLVGEPGIILLTLSDIF